jgi:thioredoxin-like negative regulator of GroEL
MMIELLLQADRLLIVDQVDDAEGIYRRVAELDPLNAIAVVGLARCALARGDDRVAHDLAARALGIDAANDVARRMEARLAEVLAHQGMAVERPASATAPGTRAMRPTVTGAPTVTGVETMQEAPTAPAVPEPVRRGLRSWLRGR